MFKLTTKQLEAQQMLANKATYHCLCGGSRSGKTLLLVRNIVLRALKAPNSRHAICRFRINAVKASIQNDTLPKVMRLCFPDTKYTLNKSEGIFSFENGSEIYLLGLDDQERCEKILGLEFVTIYLNEASQIPFNSAQLVFTRLAQQVDQNVDGVVARLKPRIYCDLNPSQKSHWIYTMFVRKLSEDKTPLSDPDNYCIFTINPVDNKDNISDVYMDVLNAMSERMKRRFLYGNFSDDNSEALFSDTIFDQYRNIGGELPDFLRIVIAVDPSGSKDESETNDAIGICVMGLGTDGRGYLLEDLTLKAGPEVWSKVVADAYERWDADLVVAETNYGGGMVQQVIRTHNNNIPFKALTSTRGKHIRAEPVSVLYTQGKIVHVGYYPELEDELCGFTTKGYTGRSPNRADALVFVVSELFGGIVNPRNSKALDHSHKNNSGLQYSHTHSQSWMKR